MASGQGYSKPSIFVSPGEVVTLGGSVNIYCKREDSPNADFYFYKEGNSVSQKGMKMWAGVAIFSITNTKLSDAGSYRCRYCFYPCTQWSEPSDNVNIFLKDPNLPKPSIQVNYRPHALGVNVIIECWGAERGLIFSLHKSKKQILLQIAEQVGGTAKFPFSTVTSKNAGNYTCQHYSSVNSFIWSEPSDPVELVARDLSLSKPSIKVNPSGQHALGTDAIIECQGPENGLIFSFHKSWIRTSQKTDPWRNTTQFHLSMVRLEDAGSYTCQYQRRKSPFVWSQPSDPVALTVRDPSLSKPSINVRPSGPLAPGSNVTIECQGPENGLNLSLFKSRDLIASQKADWSRNTTVFPLSMVTAEDAGKYSCQYHSGVYPFLWSEPSDPVQIAVRASRTRCRNRPHRSHLCCAEPTATENQAGSHSRDGTRVLRLCISGQRQSLEGPVGRTSQSCWMVDGETEADVKRTIISQAFHNTQVYPKPFISVDASGILTMGESTNIRCNSGNQPHTDFYLYKEGASLLQKVKNVQSSEVVFHFTHAQQADGGIYRCTYCFNSNSGKQCSNFSNNIYINITDPSLTIPTISVEPRRQLVLDSDITIECRGPENGLNFSLHKGSDLIASQMSEPGRNTTTFALSMKRLEDAGNYTCQYHHRENPFVWSGPSDPVELLVTGK
ncbi:immunoglobulin superfamily member 1-like [Eublepharis macularius]|uniref:immunoglobulin superfamily member 1-like n=1 Tax=Eublepharis macularius TaxID=481883 RepID=UPI002410A7E3|nr:immunoglobulin superfamily member 1-like [Eublepharis macularius]